MNRGVFQSSPVQQQIMMGGSPAWWTNLNSMRPPPSQQLPSSLLPAPSPSSSSSPPVSSLASFPQLANPSTSLPIGSPWHDNQELPESWSQLLLGGLMGGEEERCGFTSFLQQKKAENWEDTMALYQPSNGHMVDVKEERSESGYAFGGGSGNRTGEEIQATRSPWSQLLPVSSPNSCVTSFSGNTNMLDFANNNKADGRHPKPDHSSECNSTSTGSAFKKARVQGSSTSSAQSTFKVRKEKLGDRITALHQLVSPFGKTDTASVLLEAIGYIRFLQNQIEALSSPYLGNARHSSGQGERGCIFPEEPGQLLNDACLKRPRGASSDQKEPGEEPKKDLKSRGLCLVPISCTMHVGSDNGADFWAPTLGGGFR